jgi:hypothetical protein
MLLRAEAIHDVVDGALDRRVGGGADGYDAVAVEGRAVIDFLDVERVLERDRGGVGLAQLLEDHLGRGADCRPGLRGLVDRIERQAVVAVLQLVPILEGGRRPFDGGKHLRRTDASIAIGVDQIERALVELNAAGRAGERDPKLLIERRQMGDIGTGVDADLVETASTKEPPDMVMAPLLFIAHALSPAGTAPPRQNASSRAVWQDGDAG